MLLVRTINLALKDRALKESILSKVFETYWKQFEVDFNNIIKTTPELESSVKRNDSDIMLDVLTTVRLLDRRLRAMESNSDIAKTTNLFQNTNREPVDLKKFLIGSIDNTVNLSLEDEIKSMIARGLSPNEIVTIISQKHAISANFARRALKRAMVEEPDEN